MCSAIIRSNMETDLQIFSLPVVRQCVFFLYFRHYFSVQLEGCSDGIFQFCDSIPYCRAYCLNRVLKLYKKSSLTLKAPIATKVICFSCLLKCLSSCYGKQCGPRSDCSYRISLFWVHAVCFYTILYYSIFIRQ